MIRRAKSEQQRNRPDSQFPDTGGWPAMPGRGAAIGTLFRVLSLPMDDQTSWMFWSLLPQMRSFYPATIRRYLFHLL